MVGISDYYSVTNERLELSAGKRRTHSEVNSSPNPPAAAKGIKHYSNRHRILLVGEGDFSFSTCLARAFGSAPYMVATSLNSEDFLAKNYGNAMSNLAELRLRHCKVMHEIDATLMANHEFLGRIKFDIIIFNFPFAGFFKLSSQAKLKRHTRLVSLFMENAKGMLSENGEIHISHKTNGVHAEWKLESMAASHGLMLREAVDFKLDHYPGYNTKRGFGGDRNFNCYPSMTYKFVLKVVLDKARPGHNKCGLFPAHPRLPASHVMSSRTRTSRSSYGLGRTRVHIRKPLTRSTLGPPSPTFGPSSPKRPYSHTLALPCLGYELSTESATCSTSPVGVTKEGHRKLASVIVSSRVVVEDCYLV